VQLQSAVRFRREHREQPGAAHRLVNLAGEPPVRLGAGGVLLDERPDAFHCVKKMRHVTCSHGALPRLRATPAS
jgi:hypothetical protein